MDNETLTTRRGDVGIIKEEDGNKCQQTEIQKKTFLDL